MDVERTGPERTGLERRVDRYAALADPVRLTTVDLLTLGDVSPVELQRRLDISSSLLAHHLGLLEREGFLTRSRSQADKRRTYLRLRPGAFSGLAPSPALATRRVLFVCSEGSARSVLAAALWRTASAVPAVSAGTHPADQIDPGAISLAGRYGLTLDAAPRALDDVLTAGDLVITVCDAAHEDLDGTGQLHWSVPDPVPAGTAGSFEATFDDLAARIVALTPRVTLSTG
ncbi:MAG: helix-turn-helix domain-containing protein [Micrococcales bacterium]|nr:helix-turn-helix domain-containing protein [Micrococcales bacterium]